MKVLKTIDRYLALTEGVIIVLFLTTMIGLAFLQVVLRNFFSTGIPWADTFLRHLVLWVAFLGASLSTRENKHINIDVLTKLLRPRGKLWSKCVVEVLSLAVCLFLGLAAWTFLAMERQGQGILFNNIPIWIFQIILPLGFFVIAFRFFLRVLDSLLILSQKPR